MWNTWTASPKETSTGIERRARRQVGAVAGRRDEEVQQHRLAPGGATSM